MDPSVSSKDEVWFLCVCHHISTGLYVLCFLIDCLLTRFHPKPANRKSTKSTTRTNCCIYRVFQEECARLREGVPYVKIYRYNPKHLCPKLNGYGDNGQGKVWFSCGSTHCTCQLTILPISVLECGVI